jgi:hypothetical protein
MFAKLFETDEGQILVRLDTNSADEPSVVFSFEVDPAAPRSAMYDLAIGFDSWEAAEEALNRVDQEKALPLVRALRYPPDGEANDLGLLSSDSIVALMEAA